MTEGMETEYDVETAQRKDDDDDDEMFDFIEQFMKSAFSGLSYIVKYVGFLLAMLMCVAIPIAMIVVGVVHRNDCPAERLVPIYLIVGGVVGTLFAGGASVYIALGVKTKKQQEKSKGEKRESTKRIVTFIMAPFIMFFLAWFVAGNVWVFRVFKKHQNSDHEAADYCHRGTFNFTAILIIGTYVGFVILFGLFSVIWLCMKRKKSG